MTSKQRDAEEKVSRFFKSEEEEARWRDFRKETFQEELIRRIRRDAHEFQVKYRGCAQACAHALIVHLRPGGVTDPWTVLPGLNTLCGGIASLGTGPCGALLGALYVVGMEFGRKSFYQPGSPREGGFSDFFGANVQAGKVYDKFLRKWGTVTCNEIRAKELGGEFATDNFGLDDPVFFKMHEDGSLYDILSVEASRTVADAAEMAAEVILKARGRTPWIPVDE
jgi:hypothetical protein